MEKEPKFEYQEVAKELERLEFEYRKEGIGYVHWIVEDLRRGDFEAAKNNYEQQSDKYDSYPKIKTYLESVGIAKSLEQIKREQGKYLNSED